MAEAKKTADTPLRVPTAEKTKVDATAGENGKVGVDEVIPVYKEKPVINIDGLTARDMLDFATDRDVRFTVYAGGAVVSLPAAWGAGDPGRKHIYKKVKLRNLRQINKVFLGAMREAKPDFIEGLIIDVWDITAEETENLEDADVVDLVARYTKQVPKNWGGANDVETFLNLPQPVWLTVLDVLMGAIEDLGKN